MTDDFANDMCTAYTSRIDKVSLHSGPPGTDGANIIGAAVAVSWSTPVGGESIGTAVFPSFLGAATHLGLWDGTVFCDSRQYRVTFGVAAGLTVLVVHRARATSA
ncbi:hypothetical protein [Mycolicibacterium fortuitum]|uniref:hypothetical protein n=1 Tax=Mycolicibacterium fortuitum TaxID=1766 RepID=UPI00260D704E|nr:hypothetical protein [Mycolicibacterium fortuitum]